MDEQHINFDYFLFNRMRPVVPFFLGVGTSTSSTFWLRVCQRWVSLQVFILDITTTHYWSSFVHFDVFLQMKYRHFGMEPLVMCSELSPLFLLYLDFSTSYTGVRSSASRRVVRPPFSCWETSMFRCADSSTKVGRITFQITACSFSDWEKLCVLCEKSFILWAKALRSKYLALLV